MELVVLALLVVLVAAVLLLPLWSGRRKKQISDKLTQYQLLAEALLEKDMPRAREALKVLIRDDTEDVAAYLRLARILREEGDIERSVALYRSLRARELSDRVVRLQILEGLAEDLHRLHRYDEARSVAQELRALDRHHPLLARLELEDALVQQDWARALKVTDGLLRAGRGGWVRPSQVRTYIAARKADGGLLREGRKLVEEVLKDDPQYVPALLLLGDLRSRQSDHEAAAEIWTRLLRAHPDLAAQLVGRLERSYFEMGRFSDLSVVYDELAAATPEAPPTLQLARARMALRRGQPEEALQIVEALLERHPEHAAGRSWRYFLLLETGRTAEAHAALRDDIEGALASPPQPRCPGCGSVVELPAVRCPSCQAWLPDPGAARPALLQPAG